MKSAYEIRKMMFPDQDAIISEIETGIVRNAKAGYFFHESYFPVEVGWNQITSICNELILNGYSAEQDYAKNREGVVCIRLTVKW